MEDFLIARSRTFILALGEKETARACSKVKRNRTYYGVPSIVARSLGKSTFDLFPDENAFVAAINRHFTSV